MMESMMVAVLGFWEKIEDSPGQVNDILDLY